MHVRNSEVQQSESELKLHTEAGKVFHKNAIRFSHECFRMRSGHGNVK